MCVCERISVCTVMIVQINSNSFGLETSGEEKERSHGGRLGKQSIAVVLQGRSFEFLLTYQ